MSTGLTYLTITDISSTGGLQSGLIVFSSYEEAYNFGDWYCRFIYDYVFGATSGVNVSIYTTGPSQNGFFSAIAGIPFTAFD